MAKKLSTAKSQKQLRNIIKNQKGDFSVKYGMLMHKTTCNIGDDIQSYASSKFLPQIDYFVDRETINTFTSEKNEPVATVMSAWYMWEKWNWPPAKCIYPKFVGMHYSDHQISKQPGSPIKTEFLEGIGNEYLNAYSPIGVRDYSTLKSFKEIGIDAYYSGCITLTLPKMQVKTPEKEYICVVDVEKPVIEKIKKEIENTGIELKIVTHRVNYRDYDISWDERKDKVEELLTLYQNAKCVVTRRLHCALPCLALGVPVLTIITHTPAAANRFEPFYDYLNNCTQDEYLNGKYDYDVTNPPQNNGKHIEVRNKLISDIEEFIKEANNNNKTTEELCRTNYSDNDIMIWKNEKMKDALHAWLLQTRKFDKEFKKLKKECDKLKLQRKKDKALIKTLKKFEKENKKLVEKDKQSQEKLKTYERMKKSRLINGVISIRNKVKSNKIELK